MFRSVALLGVILLAQAIPSSCNVPALDINLNVNIQEQTAPSEADAANRNNPDQDNPNSPSLANVGDPVSTDLGGTGASQPQVDESGKDVVPGDDGQNPTGPRTGAIFGQVLGTTDDAPAGVPLTGARVALVRDDGEVRSVETDEEGRYVMESVPAGEYGMLVRAENYVPGRARVRVIAGQRTEQNFLLREMAHGAIFGHVMTEGHDGGRVPVEGALVRLRRDGEVVRETRTNDRGLYVFPHVRPGAVGMVVLKQGFLPAEARVEVVADQRTEQNFVLEQNRESAGAIIGHVGTRGEDEGVVPVAGAHVRLMRGNNEVGRTETNDRGGYAFSDLLPGLYRLVVVAEGFLPEEARALVRPRERTEQNFLLRRPEPGVIFGRVGRVGEDGTIAPIAGAIVKLFVANTEVVRETQTNERGLYVFENVRPGIYGVGAGNEGCAPRVERVEARAGQRVEQNFVLRCGEPEPRGRIVGRVMGEGADGVRTPIARAVVTLLNENGEVLREVLTGPLGGYEMPGVPVGTYGMAADADGWQPADAEVTVNANAVTEQHFLLVPD